MTRCTATEVWAAEKVILSDCVLPAGHDGDHWAATITPITTTTQEEPK